MVQAVGHVDVAPGVDRQAARRVEERLVEDPVREAGLDSGQGGDLARAGVHPSQTIVEGVRDQQATVGVGEVVLPQLSRDRPLPQAAGTSVAVVAGTAAAAAVTQVAELDASEVPWELVRYTIPGVILGGQIAPRLAGRLDDRQIERAAAALFAVVGAAFALKAATG